MFTFDNQNNMFKMFLYITPNQGRNSELYRNN